MKIFKQKNMLILMAAAFIITMVSGNIMAYSYSSYGNSYSGNYYSNRSSYGGNSYYSGGYYNGSSNYSNNYSNYYRSRYGSTTPDTGNTGSNNNTGNNDSNNGTSTGKSSGPVLKQGVRTTGTRYLEVKLKGLGYDVTVDGYYGRDTTVAVMSFQRKYGLPVTGNIDVRTRDKIREVYAARPVNDPAPAPTPEPEPEPQPTPDPQPAPQPSTNLSQLEQQMLNMINQERRANGLQPLRMDSRLVNLARKKSQDMIDNNYFSHNSPTYGSPFKMLNDAGVNYNTAGENLAGNSSVSGAHRALMNSSGHRRNILSSKFTRVGIGIKKGGPYGMMFTQIFTG